MSNRMQAPEPRFDSLWYLTFIVSLFGILIMFWSAKRGEGFMVIIGGGVFVLGVIIDGVRKRTHFKEKQQFEKEMKSQGLQKVLNQNNKEVWVKPEQLREWIDLDNNFQRVSPRDFEILIGSLFTKMNYDVKIMPYTGDYGADVVIKKNDTVIVVQCKRYKLGNNIGAPIVQRTLGSMFRYNADKAILITTSDFTRQARNQAVNAPIELWNNSKLREQFEIHYFKN